MELDLSKRRTNIDGWSIDFSDLVRVLDDITNTHCKKSEKISVKSEDLGEGLRQKCNDSVAKLRTKSKVEVKVDSKCDCTKTKPTLNDLHYLIASINRDIEQYNYKVDAELNVNLGNHDVEYVFELSLFNEDSELFNLDTTFNSVSDIYDFVSKFDFNILVKQ